VQTDNRLELALIRPLRFIVGGLMVSAVLVNFANVMGRYVFSRPFVWGEPPDQELVNETLNEHIPRVLDYLETQAPAEGFCFGQPSIADIAISSFFRNAAFARYRIDAVRWPKTAALVERTLALPAFQALRPFEEKSVRTPVAEHRSVLAAMGAPLTADTVGTTQPRRA